MAARNYRYPLSVRMTAVAACFAGLIAMTYVVGERFDKGAIPSDPRGRAAWLEDEVLRNEAQWRNLAFAYVASGQYAKVPDAFMKAAAFYRSEGDVNAAVQMERSAEKYVAEARIFLEKQTDPAEAKRYYTGAKFEPVYGCYLGAFIENEPQITDRYLDEQNHMRPHVAAFDKAVGVKHAIFFRYLGYGVAFPKKWAEDLKSHRTAAQLAFEPDSLDKVKDDAYLRQFARDAKASGVPVFLRFASEMNGNWTPYHGDPGKYIEKWRLVTKVMREEAPNVAMLWCVFETPVTKVEEYFPGDDYVDWVGVNVYSVPYFNNDPKQKADWRNAADGVKFVYDKYSAKHPIMVAEYAASHLSSLDNVYRGEVARIKLSQFYTALPRIYPRIKAVCWLSMNAIAHAIPGRQKNDYSLLSDPPKAVRYRQMVATPYFFHDLVLGKKPTMSPVFYEELSGRVDLPTGSKYTVSAWARCWENEPTIRWNIDIKPTGPGRRLQIGKDMKEVGPYSLEWQPYGRLGLSVLDSMGRIAAKASVFAGFAQH